MMRLDKFLADMDVGTRTEVKKLIRKGTVVVNGEIIKQPEYKVSQTDEIVCQGEAICYQKYVYYMLHKPAGVVSATEDNIDTTVIELLKGVPTKGLFPVGRLDKDTEGLLLITNDGQLSHDLLSPKKHIDKTYYAKIVGEVTEIDVEAFVQGLEIGEKQPTLPATLEILTSGHISEVKITIQEGKFHQIKRMFQAVDKEVLYLKRLQMGTLVLDETLPVGAFRKLSEKELQDLCYRE